MVETNLGEAGPASGKCNGDRNERAEAAAGDGGPADVAIAPLLWIKRARPAEQANVLVWANIRLVRLGRSHLIHPRKPRNGFRTRRPYSTPTLCTSSTV